MKIGVIDKVFLDMHELKIFLLNYELFNLIYFVKVVGANVLCAGRLILVAK